jgi:hypothetical protein
MYADTYDPPSPPSHLKYLHFFDITYLRSGRVADAGLVIGG